MYEYGYPLFNKHDQLIGLSWLDLREYGKVVAGLYEEEDLLG